MCTQITVQARVFPVVSAVRVGLVQPACWRQSVGAAQTGPQGAMVVGVGVCIGDNKEECVSPRINSCTGVPCTACPGP